MAPSNSVYLGAIIGICVALGVCVAALIIFVIVFCRVKIKDDANTRKRLINNNAFSDEGRIERPRVMMMEEPQPVPIPIPRPMPMPMPMPMPVVIPPRPAPPPVMMRPLPAPEPRVMLREIVREREPAPQPVQSRNRDDWVLVKKVRKRKNNRRAVSDDEYDDSDDDSCHRRGGCRGQRHGVQQMRSAYPRLEAYDLATPGAGGIYGPRPAMAAAMSAQQYIPIPIMMQPTM
jgi:hypothetical protein